MKKRLAEEGANQLLTNCKQLKMKAADGKRYNTDVANNEQLSTIFIILIAYVSRFVSDALTSDFICVIAVLLS
jgi:hypothetical protein